jgi:hypothetical protein
MTRWVCDVLRFKVGLSNWMTAKAVWPSAYICRDAPGSSGPRTDVTDGKARAALTS